MTVDEGNSIYVGSLPYTATEDTIRRVFGPYGAIVAVKIMNEHGTRGKCYAFVTFRNPRSVFDAINDMNGKTIDGRAVRVNEVNTRGGRFNFGRERGRPNNDRVVDWDRGRDRERNYDYDYDRDRDRCRQQYSDRSRERERDRSWDRVEDREQKYEVVHGCDQEKTDFLGGGQGGNRVVMDNEAGERRNGDWNWENDRNLHLDQERETHGINGDPERVEKETGQQLQKLNEYNDHYSREISSDASGDYDDEMEERLERSIQKRDELKKEIFQMEKRLEEKQEFVSNLQKRTQMVEDALIIAKKQTSHHKMQLTKLHKCHLQVKECTERLKTCEQELQSLVDSAMIQRNVTDDLGRRDGVLFSGNA